MVFKPLKNSFILSITFLNASPKGFNAVFKSFTIVPNKSDLSIASAIPLI